MWLLADKAVLSGGTTGASVVEASRGPFVRISGLNTVMPLDGIGPRRFVAFNAAATSSISILCGQRCWGCSLEGSGFGSSLSVACYNNLEVSTR